MSEILVNLLALIGALAVLFTVGLLVVVGLATWLETRAARERRKAARMVSRHDRKQVEELIRDVQGAA